MNLLSAHKRIRHNLTELIQNLSEKQLSTIPKGYNNNIYWNVAHAVVTQQLLIYYLSANKMLVESSWVENFKKGTVATTQNAGFDKADLLHLLNQTTSQYELDVNSNKFVKYNEYSTSLGLTLTSVQDAMHYNNIHESLHLGYAMALRKLYPIPL